VLKANILEYFASGPAQRNIKRHDWRGTQRALRQLKAQSVKPRNSAISLRLRTANDAKFLELF
jgi:hypothetical protein